jgi:hypothetical protein
MRAARRIIARTRISQRSQGSPPYQLSPSGPDPVSFSYFLNGASGISDVATRRLQPQNQLVMPVTAGSGGRGKLNYSSKSCLFVAKRLGHLKHLPNNRTIAGAS